MVMHMMLSHMSEEPYWLLRKTFLIQLAVSSLLVVGVVPWVRGCGSELTRVRSTHALGVSRLRAGP